MDTVQQDQIIQQNCQQQKTVNINLGILGHIDSGKTSLAKAISTLHSTAAFDKSPQSKQRGITLDLGFSAFVTPCKHDNRYSHIQYTMVDCPGHASLIRTIIGGAQIIDAVLLVIDITKGIQTQTAEGLVIAEITCDKMIVVFNKIDLLPQETHEKQIEKMKLRLKKTLENTKFAESPMVCVAAHPGSDQNNNTNKIISVGLDELIETIQSYVPIPTRVISGPFIFAIDHCFPIKGQGTVLTGTVLNGEVHVNQTIDLPQLKMQKKVKSMQMFHQPVETARQGDRVGICVTQLDSKLIERGIASQPGAIITVDAAIVSVSKVKYFKRTCSSKMKFHVSVAHDTVMGVCTFFGTPKEKNINNNSNENIRFSENEEYLYQNELFDTSDEHPLGSQFALVQFETPILAPLAALVIGSKLDTDIHANSCRIAFHGTLQACLDPAQGFQKLKVYKLKRKEGGIDRVADEHTIIGKNLFKKETDINLFVGLKVQRTSNGDVGVIESAFGKSGKFKVYFANGGQTDPSGNLILEFKRFLYTDGKKIYQ